VRAENGPAAIIGPNRRALDRPVRRQIRTRDEAAMRLHVVDQDVAERPLVQRGLTMLHDERQRVAYPACTTRSPGLTGSPPGRKTAAIGLSLRISLALSATHSLRRR